MLPQKISRSHSLFFGTLLLGCCLIASCGGGGEGPGQDEKVCGERAAASGTPDWSKDAVVYEVFVRSFADSNGDGIGDLRGLISRLDYLNDGRPGGTDLGVDALWLMPIFQSPSPHGYDATDYEQIEPDYGTLADFQALVQAAHARGIRILLDLVLNHSSNQHPWFQEAAAGGARRNFYVWSNNNPGWNAPWLNGAAAWHSAGGAYYYGVFWSGMPDLNYTHQPVRDEMLRIGKLWLDRGADGYRMDAIRYLVETGSGGGQQDTSATHDYLKQFRAGLKAHRPDVFLVGEAWADTRTISGYYGNSDELDANFNFPLKDALTSSIQARNPSGLSQVLCDVARTYPQGFQDAVFLGNHDMSRMANRMESDVDRLELAAAIQMTMPGTPFIYYGEEIGMRSGAIGGDLDYRTPMLWSSRPGAGFTTGNPWLPINAEFTQTNVEQQLNDSRSLLQRYRSLLTLRENSVALRRGSFEPLPVVAPVGTNSVLAYARQSGGSAVVAVFNFGRVPVEGVSVDLSEAGLGTGASRDARTGQPGPTLEAGNRASFPIGPIPGYGFTLLEFGN